jgi:uncharacterized protein (DUF1778 family)
MADEHTLRNADPERQRVVRDVSSVVKQAASILEKELTDGGGLARDMQQKFASTRRVERGEFKVLADRVRTDVHDLIAIAAEMFAEVRTDEVGELVTRFATDAHDVVDTTMNLVEHTPDAATRFAQFGFTTPTPAGAPPPSGDTSSFDDVPPVDPPAGGES